MRPLVAIVGRPNVGKSTLFNRLIHRREAIIEDVPGVTRDRHYGTARLAGGAWVDLVDTGGFDPEAAEGMEALISRQTALAVEEADLVLVIFDARQGLLDSDRDVVQALRRGGKRALYLANKVDGVELAPLTAEFYALGLEEVLPISARHGVGLDHLEQAMAEVLPPGDPAEAAGGEEGLVRVALVGRPNAGKSSLLNRLVGQQRAIVSDAPGTTRDPVDVRVETADGPVLLVDTAGLRKKRAVAKQGVERYSVLRALRAVHQADITCLVIDATSGVVEQDAKIASLVEDKGKGLVLVLAKSDLLRPFAAGRRAVEEELDRALRFVPHARRIFLSSRTGKGVQRLLPLCRRTHQQCTRRLATSELNRFLADVQQLHPPPSHRGRPVRIYYITQPQVSPPTFLISASSAEGLPAHYRRYLVNRLREVYGFEGAPLRLIVRQRGRGGKRRN